MRILLLAGAFAPNRLDGAALVAEQQAAALRDRGHTVVVATAMPGAPGDLQRWEVAGIAVVGVAVTPPGSRTRHPDAVVGDALAQVVRAVAPDVLHVHSWQLFGAGAVAAVTAAALPTVLALTGTDPQPPADLLRAVHRIVAADGAALARSGIAPHAGTRLIAHGVAAPPPGWRRPNRSGVLRLGYLGGRDQQRGYGVLVEALTALRRTDYALHVVDRAALRGIRSLREWDFRVPGLVRLVPGFTPHGRDAFFGAIDILLHLPQRPGSTGLAVREAQLRRVWPITSAEGSVAASIQGRRDGEAVPAGSAEDLTAAIAWALDHPDTVLAMPPAPKPPTLEAESAALERLFQEISTTS